MTQLKVGDKAPDFSGKDQFDSFVSLKEFKGSKLILYFYPKDNTPGCTNEACNLRDNYDTMIKKGYKVVGVSADSIKSHSGFAEKFSLPFPLIADTEKEIINNYGVWGKKKFMGKEYDGIIRTTFVISENGIIKEIVNKVDTKNHSEQIFAL